MKIGTKGKILIATICIVSIAASTAAIIDYRNHELNMKKLREAELKAEELKESPAEVVQLRPLETLPKKEKAKIAPVQIEEPEEVKENFKAHEEIPLPDEYQEWIEYECERMKVNASYIYALIESESSFRTGILIEDGGGHSAGLCQINSVNWPDMEKKGLDPFDEFDNITYCISLIAKYVEKYADAEDLISTITTCYKAGEGGAKRLGYHLQSCEHIKERTSYFSEILGKE